MSTVAFFLEMRAQRKPREDCEQRRAMPDSACDRIPLAAVSCVRHGGQGEEPIAVAWASDVWSGSGEDEERGWIQEVFCKDRT